MALSERRSTEKIDIFLSGGKNRVLFMQGSTMHRKVLVGREEKETRSLQMPRTR
jgi:hypothetical protein